jgi:pyruvate formate lyase activating enzyme
MEKDTKELSAPVFQIIHGSFVDGFGIRSTVFLKGCPLHCKWCCNPEGQHFTQQIWYLQEHCNGCGRCVDVCKQNAIHKEKDTVSIDWQKCKSCGACADVCWMDARKPVAKLTTPQQIFERILREKPYYDRSGGGLTIGGGEATCYPEFCMELIRLCHEAQISVAIDTCGYLVREESRQVLLSADLLLFDLKGMDEKHHIENTGVSNVPILQLFEEMVQKKKPMIVRVPIIPGCNDSTQELTALASYLKGKDAVKRVDLMPYHEYGTSKYAQLGMLYPIDEKVTYLPTKRVEEIVKLFEICDLPVQIGG